MYIIFGCDEIGSTLARSLSKSGKDVTVISNDEKALAGLKELNIRTSVFASSADPLTVDMGLDALPVQDAVGFILLQKNFSENLALLKLIRKSSAEAFILTRATSDEEISELLENGADCALHTNSIITDRLLAELRTAELKKSALHLVDIIKAAKNRGMAIFLQDNPDPDAIASGLALKRIAEKYDVKSTIYYGGTIGYQENKILINLLGADLVQVKGTENAEAIINSTDKFALIEASIPSKNNILPPDVVPDIIIDHHQTDFSRVKGDFVEILPKIGANATILTRYLRQLNITPDPLIATALRYGIRVDTNSFTRNMATEDLDAAAYLSSLMDTSLLNQIINPPISAETLDIIGKAIRNREVKSSYLISFVEFITERDALPRAAELLLQLQGVSTVLVFGIDKDKVQLSARSVDLSVDLAVLLQKAFGFMNAGGHATMAAGSIDLGIFGDVSDKKSLLKITFDAVRKKFFSVVGLDIEKRETSDVLEMIEVNDNVKS